MTIGDYTRIASEVFIINHKYEQLDIPIHLQGRNHLSVSIGQDVCIGKRAMIMTGVTVGKGEVVAAGALVTKDVTPYAVVGGVPAKVISYRNE